MPDPSSVYMLCLIKRRPDLSEEQFYKYWKEDHAPKIAHWSKKNGIIGYTQVHTPKSMRQPLTESSMPLTLLEHDGAVIWEVPSLEIFLNAFADPYYINVVAPDEENFLDKSVAYATVTLGHCHKIVEGCQPLVDYKDAAALDKLESS